MQVNIQGYTDMSLVYPDIGVDSGSVTGTQDVDISHHS